MPKIPRADVAPNRDLLTRGTERFEVLRSRVGSRCSLASFLNPENFLVGSDMVRECTWERVSVNQATNNAPTQPYYTGRISASEINAFAVSW